MDRTAARPARETRFTHDGKDYVVTSTRMQWGEVQVFVTLAEAYDLGARRAVTSFPLRAVAHCF